MKAKVINIEGVGKAIFGKADGASIEEILDSIKKDIAGAANESKDKEYHDRVISLIESGIKGAKEANKTVAEFVEEQREEVLKEELDCFCPNCMIKSIETITPEDIAKYGKETVVLVCKTVNAVMKSQLAALDKRYADKMRSIEDNKERTGKSYEDMSREELIAELTKHKK